MNETNTTMYKSWQKNIVYELKMFKTLFNFVNYVELIY